MLYLSEATAGPLYESPSNGILASNILTAISNR
jgi:hypothetical protein